jgi:hypothetical protein
VGVVVRRDNKCETAVGGALMVWCYGLRGGKIVMRLSGGESDQY